MIGILLIIIGIIYLFNLNEKINLSKLTNLGEKLKSNKLNNKYISFFVYGMGFAIASLGCTLPIFLLVVTSAIKSSGFFNGVFIFLIYAAGMSFFMIYNNRKNIKEMDALYLQVWSCCCNNRRCLFNI